MQHTWSRGLKVFGFCVGCCCVWCCDLFFFLGAVVVSCDGPNWKDIVSILQVAAAACFVKGLRQMDGQQELMERESALRQRRRARARFAELGRRRLLGSSRNSPVKPREPETIGQGPQAILEEQLKEAERSGTSTRQIVQGNLRSKQTLTQESPKRQAAANQVTVVAGARSIAPSHRKVRSGSAR